MFDVFFAEGFAGFELLDCSVDVEVGEGFAEGVDCVFCFCSYFFFHGLSFLIDYISLDERACLCG